MRTSKRAVAGAAVAALAAAGAIPALTGAQGTGTRDVTVAERVRAAKFVDVKPRTPGDELGSSDRVVLRISLTDASGAVVGTGFNECVGLPTPDHKIQCWVTYRFSDGDVMLAGVVSPKAGDRVAIVGGTGVYATARGEGEIVAPQPGADVAVVLHIAS